MVAYNPMFPSFQTSPTSLRTYQTDKFTGQVVDVAKLGSSLSPTSIVLGWQISHLIFDNIPDLIDLVKQAAVALSTILPKIQANIINIVPLRSGKLQDQIFQNSYLSIKYSNTSVTLGCFFMTPNDRPKIIKNPQHNGAVGWSYEYNILHPQFVKATVVRRTKKGAYFILDDPSAEPNYLQELNKRAAAILHAAMYAALSRLTITVNISLVETINQKYIGHIQYGKNGFPKGGMPAGRKPQDLIMQFNRLSATELEVNVTDLNYNLSSKQILEI